ncbi:MAG: hypothetical protein LAO04_07635 [Acidobacteriia bacterium]|nr:hypothetical protein [Terriglobia bacterium]
MGRTQVLAVAILSAWLVATLSMWFAATKSFATVDRVLRRANPQFLEATKPLGEGSTRVVLHYLASEINRTLFWGYGALQIALGVILFLLLWRQTPRDAVGIGVAATMLALSAILTFVITPLIISLGRSMDFVPRNPPPPVMPRFWALHGSFTGLDGVKFLAGLGLLLRWIFR